MSCPLKICNQCGKPWFYSLEKISIKNPPIGGTTKQDGFEQQNPTYSGNTEYNALSNIGEWEPQCECFSFTHPADNTCTDTAE